MKTGELQKDIRNSSRIVLKTPSGKLNFSYLSADNWLYCKLSKSDVEALGIERRFSKIEIEIPLLKGGLETVIQGKALLIFVNKKQMEWNHVANEFCKHFAHFNFLSLLREGGILRICPIQSTLSINLQENDQILVWEDVDHAVTT